MIRRRLTTLLAITVAAVLVGFGVAEPAQAIGLKRKLDVLWSWTQTSASSYGAWNTARQDQADWAKYGFDWSTDYCSASPDNPLGFDFRLSCHRHDFGYRNYKAVGQFPANKSRIDDAFYADMRRKCATYNVFLQPACYSLAWTYYQAVVAFGATSITAEQLAAAQKLKAEGEARMAAANRR